MKKVLVVDDSETLRTQVTRVLAEAGFDTAEAVDGVDGLAKFASYGPDLILCDVNMPDMDGITMCEKLSSMDGIVVPPIFMLTTESSADMKARGKNAGVVAWVTKPFIPEKLVKAIGKVLS